jgi:pyruvate dehydrogenase E2 component (dihydrolipoamide acetyltransferase)
MPAAALLPRPAAAGLVLIALPVLALGAALATPARRRRTSAIAAAGATGCSAAPAGGAPAPAAAAPAAPAAAAAEEQQMTLVGYGPSAEGGRRRRRAGSAGSEPGTEPTPLAASEPAAPVAAPAAEHRVLAKPPVRTLAKTLGVDLADLTPSGPHGTISREDVTSAADGTGARTNGHAYQPAESIPSDGDTRIPIRGVRKHMAAAMVASAFTAPHVTEFVTVDVTATMELRERVAARPDFRGVKLSPLAFLARAVVAAARRTPEINASWDEAAGEIVLHHYVNLGIAAATDRGLVVPNIKNAHRMGLRELAEAISALTETARSGKTPPEAMRGGTITITNVGVFGVDTGTPILNPGEAGIVAFGAVRRMPWVVQDGDGAERIEPRWVSQLAVSFDHRLVDGQQGSQFLSDVASTLHDPGLAML